MRLLAACSACVIYLLIHYSSVAHASADNISIKELLVEIIDSNINVDCRIKYVLDDKIKAAISNGIEVSFILDIELRMEREFWLDTSVAELSREFRIKYHALSKQYVMIDTENGHERSFPDLFSAFFFIGHLRNNHLASIDILELDKQYYVRARARLQAEKLPLPLRIKSYFSPDWRPSSGWTSWPM